MDRTSWKPKVFKATESVDYKVNEVNIERGGSSMKIDGKNVIKIWESFSGWYWYAIEDQGSYTGIGADGNEVQAHAWYGYVQGMENEWGTWDSNELERAGVWTVPKSNWGWTGKESKASENWKDVADKFYKEELNKDKKSAGESWQECGEAYFVEWGYDLDYDFAEIDDIDDAKQLAKDNGGNVYLDDKLVYSVIPSIKKDPTNDKSSFTVANNLMGVESKGDAYVYIAKGYQVVIDNVVYHIASTREEAEDELAKLKKDPRFVNHLDGEINTFRNYHMKIVEESKANEVRSTVDYFNNKEIEGEDILTCTICGQDFDEQEFGLEDAKIHLRSFHGINNTFESKASEARWAWGIEFDAGNYDEADNILDQLMGNISVNNVSGTNWDMKTLRKINESKASEEYSAWDIEHAVMDDLKSFTLEWVKNNQHGGGHYNETVHVDERHAVEEIKKQFVAIAQNSYDGFETSNVAHGILSSLVSEGKLKWLGSGDGIFGGGVGYQASEGFNQGLYGYVDAKCKTSGIEFDSIPDMDDHYAMNSDHISNLDDLDNDIPNSD